MPFPKNDVRVEFYSRNRKGIFEKKFEYNVDVDSYFIKPERNLEYPAFDVHISGNPAKKVDIVILPEGYSKNELGLFINDCQKFAKLLFSFSPYTENKDKFNIRAVLAASEESGNDIPGDSIWKKTLMNTGFYTFDSERYCMTMDNKSVRDLAANAPYDQIYILVNNKKWKHLLKKKTPIPTPPKKKYLDKPGVFEGGGYVAKGVYRPAYDCLMKSFKGNEFCEAFTEAIQKMIDFYSK